MRLVTRNKRDVAGRKLSSVGWKENSWKSIGSALERNSQCCPHRQVNKTENILFHDLRSAHSVRSGIINN